MTDQSVTEIRLILMLFYNFATNPEGDRTMEKIRKNLTKGVLMLAMLITLVLSTGCDDDGCHRMRYNRHHCPPPPCRSSHSRHRGYHRTSYNNNNNYARPVQISHRQHMDEDDWEDYLEDREDYLEDQRERREDRLEEMRERREEERERREDYLEELRERREEMYDD